MMSASIFFYDVCARWIRHFVTSCFVRLSMSIIFPDLYDCVNSKKYANVVKHNLVNCESQRKLEATLIKQNKFHKTIEACWLNNCEYEEKDQLCHLSDVIYHQGVGMTWTLAHCVVTFIESEESKQWHEQNIWIRISTLIDLLKIE